MTDAKGMVDAQIIETLATKVMGWTDEDRDAWKHAATNSIYWKPTERNRTAGLRAWNPLTDPAASKQLREKLAERFNLEMRMWTGSDGKLYHSVIITKDAFDIVAEEHAVENLERAVALCAIKSIQEGE